MSSLLAINDATLQSCLKASRDGDVIKVRKGKPYKPFGFPKDILFNLTLAPEKEDDPPDMQGITLQPGAKGNFLGVKGAGNFDGLVIDGLRITAPELTQVKQKNGAIVPTVDETGRGYGWRCDYTYPGMDTLGDNAGMIGIRVGTGVKSVKLLNLEITGFAKGISINQADNVEVGFIDFVESCEDGIIVWGSKGLNAHHIRMRNFRGLPYDMAHAAFGWTDPAGVPPHADLIQFAGPSSDGTVDCILLEDETGRVHGILMNDPNKTGKLIYRNMRISNATFYMTHTTAFYGGNCDGFEFLNVKVVRTKILPSPPNPRGKNDTRIDFLNLGGKVQIVGTRARVIRPSGAAIPKSWVWQDNVETNDPANVSASYVEVREALVKPGDPFAGAHGQNPAPPPPPPPPPPPDPEPIPIPEPVPDPVPDPVPEPEPVPVDPVPVDPPAQEVAVTPEMIAAGLDEFGQHLYDGDTEAMLEGVYRAMDGAKPR